ncbi:hypothetical protein H6G20_14920 [Desertifilum sp. FACHB-1129]|uniref:hypothetical protein n=1 Tax=Desertifilum TaxID=1185872 RepID=UPI00130189E8|nr:MULTISPECIES: hypothetical protein [Desertifilum]MBD2312962.1 hypothetical protein [Desertifilum sp. FACHB-1129]MBD2320992.1 hypothetical protein [Desertifilum sp. FACHB-866]MBD2331121.1 hypothetical protein [Desertifilum sp. FACHB-868]MDA0209552.1 hypothetical protein [Cyanobacteria bacterium FC1]
MSANLHQLTFIHEEITVQLRARFNVSVVLAIARISVYSLWQHHDLWVNASLLVLKSL